MAAKDYVFQAGWMNVYLAKKTKSKTTMSQDRRVVDDNEILALFEFYLRKWSEDNKGKTLVITNQDGTKVFEAKLLDVPVEEEYHEETANDDVLEEETEVGE